MTRSVAFFLLALILFLAALVVAAASPNVPAYTFDALEASGLAAFVAGFIP